MRTLLFSDVDGTVLDAESYRWEEAWPGIARARECDAPIIFNTSKTEPEMSELAQTLGIDAPFAIENGGAVFVPPGTFNDGEAEGLIPFGAPYSVIRKALDDIQSQFAFLSLSTMTDAQVVEACALPDSAVSAARCRSFSEPLVWRDDPSRLDEFAEILRPLGLRLNRGDRFVHVMGPTDKRVAVEYLIGRYRRQHPELRSVALGNGPNDLGMMQVVDIAVVIQNPNGRNIQYPGARVPQGTGPTAWSRAVLELLQGN